MKNNSHTTDISRFIDDKSQDEENQENNINFFIKLSDFLWRIIIWIKYFLIPIRPLNLLAVDNNQVDFLVSYGVETMGCRVGIKEMLLLTTIKLFWMNSKMFL